MLTDAETAFLDAVLAGKRAELGGETLRAGLIRAVATEANPDWIAPPIGISLYNAVIEGPLDLEGCSISNPLIFLRCKFSAGGDRAGAIRLRDAALKRMALYDCAIDGDIKADRVHIESALFMTGSAIKGMVRLRGASLGEALAMDGVDIQKAGEIAVLADGLRLGGPMILRKAVIAGEVRLAGARVGGNLLWEEARLCNAGVAVTADGAICDGAWILRRAHIDGGVRFRGMTVKAIDAPNVEIAGGAEGMNGRGASIGGDLALDGATLSGGLKLGRARVGGELSARGALLSGLGGDWAIAAAGVVIDRGVALLGAKLTGGLSLANAVVGHGIAASNIEIAGSGRAIEADVMRLGGNWIMRGAKISGSVRFAGAHIEGQIGFTESRIEGAGGLAIRADGAFVAGGWFMGRADIRGLVRLPAARLGNEMRLRGAKLAVSQGPAFFANGVKITRELVLDGGFEATGGVVLDHAEIAGMMDLSGSRVVSALLARGGAPRESGADVLDPRYDEAAISLVDTRLDRLVMPDSAETRPRGVVDLSRARAGSYEDAAAAWPPSAASRKGDARGRDGAGHDADHLVLDGFQYDHLENPSGLVAATPRSSTSRLRTRWLESQSEADLDAHFKPQAWVQLANRLAAQGYHDDARAIAIARRRRQRASASASKSAKLQGWLLDVFALYGYNPWRTVVWMALFVVMFAGLWQWAAHGCARADCKDESVYAMALKGDFGQDDKKATAAYPAFHPLAYSLDVFLPFVNLGFEDHWRPRLDYGPLVAFPAPGGGETAITAGQILYAAFVVETLAGLILASLAVTGFTGLLKSGDDAG